ncbi:MAG: Glucose-6-phosphate isomerase [uncultured Rubrobacteraceae bacterium]|uniref:Glucose-6-phosphate isomerase n=1 Tax=uncultured Rubrobacteraceae bacterium TaxID=349277 RepID=A0A6J4PCB9_9ACTN|nr:MAG: Glucose-6-phosphate isomerase [uncultured Rubrobacteraceae bacterium]
MGYKQNASLGAHEDTVAGALSEVREGRIVGRMLEGDHTVWGPEPEEIANRLGWLESPENTGNALRGILDFAETIRAEGIEHVLLLGMGGSSLAPEVFGFALQSKEGYPDLAVLDSTDPEAVSGRAEGLDLSRTLFVVSTKSGGTEETFSFFKYFYSRVAEIVGEERAGSHFVAITDPGSGLADTAEKYGFRETFLNDPNIGGRYSALSHFGIVPAALSGVDVERLLGSGRAAKDELVALGEDDPGVWLGTAVGELARSAGRDKLTLLTSPVLAPFGPWAEQLVAESTGKDGVGILPVAEEPEGPPDVYGEDRVFVSLRLRDEGDGSLDGLRDAGHPVIEILLDDPYDLGGEMFRWEVATAVSGWRLGINPFDQPNVESAKVQARKMVAEYREKGELPEPEPTVEEGGISVYSEGEAAGEVAGEAAGVEGALETFLSQAKPGDYVSLQAYLPPSEATTEALQGMRVRLRERLKVATTLGYGPRFLHSTGQLHKGDGGNGLFVQFTADPEEDPPIPDEAGGPEATLTFGVLEAAQAPGDRQALLDIDRRVIRFHLGADASGNLRRLIDGIRGGHERREA